MQHPHFTVNVQRPHSAMMLMMIRTSQAGGRCIFTVNMLTFSGESAWKFIGGNGLDCPAIFLGRGSSTFWGVVEDMLEH